LAVSRQIEALGFFIPAAQFFYFTAPRRRGALGQAVRRAGALPRFPLGWKKETRARFLAWLHLEEAPECPAGLREELSRREREGKPIVPRRIARQIMASPSNVRCYSLEARCEQLAQIDLAAIASRLAELEPGGTCRLRSELL